ncbi:MAG TPA: helix-turn-helix domain-containing protein [Solirubrobacteraceae bacterium]|jgi:transposase
MDKGSLALLLSQGLSVEKIAERFDKHPSTVAYWMKKHGLEAVNREKHAAKGEIDPEQLRGLVAEGLSISELAERLERSKATVRHWLKRHGLETALAARRSAVRAAVAGLESEPQRLVLRCRVHGDTDFVREGSGYFRCVRCRSASVMRHRRRLKEQLVAEAGGRCVLCGYDRRARALEFHHVDPGLKQFALSRKGVTLSLEALRAEASKCVLLCSNCHAEVEDGSVVLPDTVPGNAG